MEATLERKLTYVGEDGRERIEDEAGLIARGGSLVILGEAGMGKTTLLDALAGRLGHKPCTARQLINAPDPKKLLDGGDVLVVDALDEVATAGEGDAVDRVLGKLGALGYPRFILSCRAADWRGATAMQGIAEQYAAAPLELYLRPFDDDDARAFLALTVPDQAAAIVERFRTRELSDLLGNPQTLKMIAAVAAAGDLPETIGGIFARAVEIMRHEHRDEKTHGPLATAPPDAVLDAVGAAFAALILTGSDALSRLAVPRVAPGDLPAAMIAGLPDAGRVASSLDSRLWRSEGADRFTYVHRRIGEYLGARWLASHANTPARRKRLLARFRTRGLVPASLRGLHAWLARSPELAMDAIAADPMGVVEYGDADALTVDEGRALLRALEASPETSNFRGRGRHSMRGVTQEALREDVRRLLAAPKTEVLLRVMLLDALKGSPIAASLAPELRELILDPEAAFVVRSRAGEALATLGMVADWPEIIERLRCLADEGSLRLAVELLEDAGFARFDDRQIVEVIFAQTGVSLCAVPRNDGNRSVIGLFWTFEKSLPDDRFDGVLDGIAEYGGALHDRDGGYRDAADLTNIAYSLIARRIASRAIDPLRIWRWMEPFDAGSSDRRESGEAIAAYFRSNQDARRAIQRHVLLDQSCEKTVWGRVWRLERRSPALSASLDPQDLVELLRILGTPEAATELQVGQWRDLVQLAGRGPERGMEVRDAARAFAATRTDLLAWLDELGKPHVPEWQLKQDERKSAAEAERQARWAEHRVKFLNVIEKVRTGQPEEVVSLAKAYLWRFEDIDRDLPAHERIAEWLGPELQAAAFESFEAYLRADPPQTTAVDIAESSAGGRLPGAASIVVAALAERVRGGRSLCDLPDERLHAGWLGIRRAHVEEHAKIEGVTAAIEAELRRRDGAWEACWRLQVEPQLARGLPHLFGLYELMRNEADVGLATDLSAEWLVRFPDMPAGPEQEMIDRLLGSGRFDLLRDAGARRRANGFGDRDEPRRNWDAIELLIDFDAARVRIGDDPERELLWHLRERSGDRRYHVDGRGRVVLNAEQSAWMVRGFRNLWPNTE